MLSNLAENKPRSESIRCGFYRRDSLAPSFPAMRGPAAGRRRSADREILVMEEDYDPIMHAAEPMGAPCPNKAR
jgi:hypothetical protein